MNPLHLQSLLFNCFHLLFCIRIDPSFLFVRIYIQHCSFLFFSHLIILLFIIFRCLFRIIYGLRRFSWRILVDIIRGLCYLLFWLILLIRNSYFSLSFIDDLRIYFLSCWHLLVLLFLIIHWYRVDRCWFNPNRLFLSV